METQIVQINPEQFGIEESKAKEIAAQFQPMLDKMVELEEEYNEVVKLDPESPETSTIADELRKKYVKVRTGTAAIHKKQKEFYLAGGRFVDGWKNAQHFASQGKEENLERIAKYAQIKEQERQDKIASERAAILAPYETSTVGLNLGGMAEDVWNNFLNGVIQSHKAQKEAEEKARIEAEAKAKAEAEEREKMRIENEKLKAEAEAREKQIAKEKAEAEAKAKAERESREKAESELRAVAEAEAKAKQEAEEKARKIQQDYEDAVRRENERITKLVAEAEAKKQAELAKGDADKMFDLTEELDRLTKVYQFESALYTKKYEDVKVLIGKIISHINK